MLSTLSENCCDLQSWIEEAMVEIAIENEVNEECKELSLAMEVRSYADYYHPKCIIFYESPKHGQSRL